MKKNKLFYYRRGGVLEAVLVSSYQQEKVAILKFEAL